MGGFSDFFTGKEGELKIIDTMNEQQKAMMQRYGDWLGEGLGGATPWEGPFGVNPSELESMGLDKLKEYMNQGPSEIRTQGLDAFSEALKGLSPEYMTQLFRDSVLPGQQRIFNEEVLPNIRESFVGPGTFYSQGGGAGGRIGAEGKASEQFGEYSAGVLKDMILKGQEYGRDALQYLPGMVNMVEGDTLKKAEAGMSYGALPRMLEQDELNARMADFIRTQPENSPIAQYMQPFLNTQTMSSYFQPGTESPFLKLADASAKMIAALRSGQTPQISPPATSGAGAQSMAKEE